MAPGEGVCFLPSYFSVVAYIIPCTREVPAVRPHLPLPPPASAWASAPRTLLPLASALAAARPRAPPVDAQPGLLACPGSRVGGCESVLTAAQSQYAALIP